MFSLQIPKITDLKQHLLSQHFRYQIFKNASPQTNDYINLIHPEILPQNSCQPSHLGYFLKEIISPTLDIQKNKIHKIDEVDTHPHHLQPHK